MIRAACLLTCLAAPAAAQAPKTFTLPQGCDAFLTVQSRSCTVDHHFTCTGEPDGVKHRVSLDETGVTYLGSTDAETQWLTSFHALLDQSERLEDAPADRASLTELLETGVDTYDFRTLSDQAGATRYMGYDRLTGELVTIDDVTLHETEYQITAFAPDGTELWSSGGNEYVSERWRVFFGGVSTITVPGDSFEEDSSPVEFLYPGEPGFLSANPKFDCGATMSSLRRGP